MDFDSKTNLTDKMNVASHARCALYGCLTLLFCVLSLLFSGGVYAQIIEQYTTSGDKTFTVPAGVSAVTIECWGGGGGGGGARGGAAVHAGGGGGGGYSKYVNYPVSPGQTLSVHVGAGGSAGRSYRDGTKNKTVNGGNGGASYVNNGGTRILTANGGSGAQSLYYIGLSGVNGSGADGGTASGGHYNYTGGRGANAGGGGSTSETDDWSGGGGGAAGFGGNGGGAYHYQGGAGASGNPSTGDGGNGRDDEGGTGHAGASYGGGGGGGLQMTVTSDGRSGGAGAVGCVRITYYKDVTLTFDLNGGQWVTAPAGSYQVTCGMAYRNRTSSWNWTPPTRAGYEFRGWELDNGSGQLFGPDALCTQQVNHKLKAKWQAVETPPATLSVCADGTLSLHAPSGFTGYTWSPSTALSSTSAQNPTLSGASMAVGTTTYTCKYTLGEVYNSDFTQGNTGFSTSYTMVADQSGNYQELYPARTASVVKCWSDVHDKMDCAVKSYGDGASGKFLAVNGGSLPEDVVWEQTLIVDPNITYRISMRYAASVSSGASNPAQLRIFVNGVDISGSSSSASSASWNEIAANWNSGSTVYATVQLKNFQVAAEGNDFSIDHVVVTPTAGAFRTYTVDVTKNPAFNAGAIVAGSKTIVAGETADQIASSTAASGGDNDISYQWQISKNNGAYTDIDGATGATYTPSTDYTSVYGVYKFKRLAKDATCQTTLASSNGEYTLTVQANVQALNDTFARNIEHLMIPLDVLDNDDLVGQDLTPSVTTNPSHGTVVWNSTTKQFDYTPAANYNGDDSFVYKLVASNTSSATVVIKAVGLNLGCSEVAESCYKFTNATFSGVASKLSVSYTNDPTGCSIALPTLPAGWVAAGSSVVKNITLPATATAAQIQQFIRNISFCIPAGKTQTISITADLSAKNDNIYYFSDNDHYYRYVPFVDGEAGLTWLDCYKLAKNSSLYGRQGYLATITSLAEDKFLTKISGAVAWLGGTRLSHGASNGQYYDSFDPAGGVSAAPESAYTNQQWYWACGPEKGTIFMDAYNATKSMQIHSVDNPIAVYQLQNAYSNWNAAGCEPNTGSNCSLLPWDDDRESCLTILNIPDITGWQGHTEDFSWNDVCYYSNGINDPTSVYSPKGYLIEYGDLLVGNSKGDVFSSGVTANAVIGEAVITPAVREYVACVGDNVLIELKNLTTDYTYAVFTTSKGNTYSHTTDHHLFTKVGANIDTAYVQVYYRGIPVCERIKIPVQVSTFCGSTTDMNCDGLELFVEDFGGNSTSDPRCSATANPNVVSEMQFTPSTDPASGHYGLLKHTTPDWAVPDNTDHTYMGDATRGYFMMIDPTDGMDNKPMYEATIDNLCGGSSLAFSFWAADLHYKSQGVAVPKFDLQLEDPTTHEILVQSSIWTPEMATTPNQIWHQFGFNYVVPEGVQKVIFRISNRNNDYIGNDYMIDDIKVIYCGGDITQSQTEMEVCTGSSVTMTNTVTLTGSSGIDEPAYKWQFTKTPATESSWTTIDTLNSVTLKIDSATTAHTGYYRMFVADTGAIKNVPGVGVCALQTPENYHLTVLAPFDPGTISSKGDTIIKGETAETTISIAAASGGKAPYSYQWYCDGVLISGATATTFTPGTTYTGTIGNYTFTRKAKDSKCSTTLTSSAGSWKLTVNPQCVNVSFNANARQQDDLENCTPAPATQCYGLPYGSHLSEYRCPTFPTSRRGYSFGGWYENAEGTGAQVCDTTKMLKSVDHTLYAKWIPDSMNVSWNKNCTGTIVGTLPATTKIKYAQEYSEVTNTWDWVISREGYIFKGWCVDSSTGDGLFVGPNSHCSQLANHTLYAIWMPVPKIDSVFVCYAQTETLTAPEGYTFYLWTPTTGLDDPTKRTPKVDASVLTAGEHTYTCKMMQNPLYNNDFSKGAIGFYSEYEFKDTLAANNPRQLLDERTYAVLSNAYNGHPAFFDTIHSYDPGNKYMLCNGGDLADDIVWEQSVKVDTNKVYTASAYAAYVYTLLGENPAQLRFYVNGTAIGTVTEISDTKWTNFSGTWNSGSSQYALIQIKNMQTAYSGNDFALDHITFSPNDTTKVPMTLTVYADFNAGSIVAKDTAIAKESPIPVIGSVADATGGKQSTITYQWYVNGEPIEGATGATYDPSLTYSHIVGPYVFTREAKDEKCNTTLELSSNTYKVTIIDVLPPCIGCQDPDNPNLHPVNCDTIAGHKGYLVLNTDLDKNTYTHPDTTWDVTATDDVGVTSIIYKLTGVTTGTGTSLKDVVFNMGKTTVYWYASDAAGNVDSCYFIVYVEDNQAPEIDCPDTIKGITCMDLLPVRYTTYAQFVAAGGVITDNDVVKESSFTMKSERSDGKTCPETITRVYYIEDASGNSSTCEHAIIVHDTIKPTFTIPSNQPDGSTIVCRNEDGTENLSIALTGDVTDEADNCTDVSDLDAVIVSTTLMSGTDFSDKVYKRTWSLTDDCGNTTIKDQYITVRPSLKVPGAVDVVCPKDTFLVLYYGKYDTLMTIDTMEYVNHMVGMRVTMTTTLPENSVYRVGTNFVDYVLTDECGYTVSCRQRVIVAFPGCDSVWDANGYAYSGVRIGANCWTGENLRNTVYFDGTPISNYRSYQGKDSLEEIYGKLYSWYSALGVPEGDDSAEPTYYEAPGGVKYIQGICPRNWAIPTDAEYEDLIRCANGVEYVRDSDSQYWLPGAAGLTPDSEFDARGAGYYDTGLYYNLMGETYFWTGDIITDRIKGHCAVISYYCPESQILSQNKGRGQSVRCVKKL